MYSTKPKSRFANAICCSSLASMPSSTPPTRHETLVKVYADLVDLHPDNTRYIKQYAELLITMNKVTDGTRMLRRLHRQLLKDNEANKADALLQQYPMIKNLQPPHQETDDIKDFLPASIHNRLWLRLHQKRLREGQHLFHRGETLDTIYLVHQGEVAEFAHAADGSPILVNLIQAGDIVAEDKLLHPGDQQHDLIANKKSIIVKLARKKMLAALLSNPQLNDIITRKAKHRRLLRFISSSPVLQSIPLEMRQHLVQHSTIEIYSAGSSIHTAGEKLNHVDLIVEGAAQFHWQSPTAIKHLATLMPGALIGETAIIHDSGCPADLRTQDGVTIIHISYAAFISTLQSYPPLRKNLTAYTEAQRRQLMSKLNELQTQELP